MSLRTPPGPYTWLWSGDNSDGTTTYGDFTWNRYGGISYSKLELSNDVNSYDAYIEQSANVTATAGGQLGQ